MMIKILEVEDLKVDFNNHIILDNLNFSVTRDTTVAIIGANGSGKTVLFKSILNLIKYEGKVTWASDVKIGYVPQKPIFEKNFPATVNDIVRMGLRKESDECKIDEILQQLWIHELRKRRIGELSAGQQQRVFIAKALVNNPKILILDEPVTGIDQQSIDLFYSILTELNSKQNITIIWSSHDLDAVNQLANHVACLNRTLFFHGESDDFFKNPELVKQYSESSMQEHMHNH